MKFLKMAVVSVLLASPVAGLAATYDCTLQASDGKTKKGAVDTANATSGFVLQDDKLGIVLFCMTPVDENEKPAMLIACGVADGSGKSLKIHAARQQNGKMMPTSGGWSSIAFADDTAPMAGSLFNASANSENGPMAVCVLR